MHLSFWRQKFKYTSIYLYILCVCYDVGLAAWNKTYDDDDDDDIETLTLSSCKLRRISERSDDFSPSLPRNEALARIKERHSTGLDRSRAVWRNEKRSQYWPGQFGPNLYRRENCRILCRILLARIQ